MPDLPVVPEGILRRIITEGNDSPLTPMVELPPVVVPPERGEVPPNQLVNFPHLLLDYPAVPDINVVVGTHSSQLQLGMSFEGAENAGLFSITRLIVEFTPSDISAVLLTSVVIGFIVVPDYFTPHGKVCVGINNICIWIYLELITM